MEGMATGRMLVTSFCHNFVNFTNRTSTSRIRPVCKLGKNSVRSRSCFRFCNSCCGILFPRHSCSKALVVHCCTEDEDPQESGNIENPNDWHQSQGEVLGYHNRNLPLSKASDGEELDRLRRENAELRTSLAALSQSLASVSLALNEVSRAVQLVSNAVDCGPSENGVLGLATSEPHPAAEHGDTRSERLQEQEPLTHSTSIASPENTGFLGVQDPVEAQLLEQNMIAHKLAYKIQQAFVQARIEGLGKPFQLAAEDFVANCLEAHAMGLGLKELQLQLILLEGSLTGVFAIRNQRYSDDPVMNEENRVRSSWVRLVYTTLAEVKERRSRVENAAGVVGKDLEQPDPSDAFVKELVRLAYEEGHDLERIKLEQNVSGPATSGAVKTMRQSTYLVLLTLQKTTNDTL